MLYAEDKETNQQILETERFIVNNGKMLYYKKTVLYEKEPEQMSNIREKGDGYEDMERDQI